MSDRHVQPVNLADYQLRLPAFEGPLDLLLRLIERAALPINEISLVTVTDQFLAHVRELGGIDPEALADFTAIGARLVLLKSRSLLPRPATTEEDDEVEDLVARLREYQVAKEAARQLEERRQSNDRAYARAAFISCSERRLRRSGAARCVRTGASAASPPFDRSRTAAADQRPAGISIRAVLERVLAKVNPGRRWRFTGFTGPEATRDETMTTFLATLVLVRWRVLDADQTEPFGPIELLANRRDRSVAD
ncbi:MAG: ScpA family protein [Thermomicrobiales bacterium]